MRAKKMNFFEILIFSEKCQNSDRRELCIFWNLGLSGVGFFCTHATKNEFFFLEILLFSEKCQNTDKIRIYAFSGI